MFLTSVLALTGAADLLRLPTGSAPVRIGIVVLVLALGTGLVSALDRPGARAYWQMGLFSTLILMPAVALQASASRVPFVALARGSAGPLLWLTLITGIILVGLWVFVAHQTEDAPENAALLFLPAGLLVPAMLGAPGLLDETATLSMLGEATLVAGVTILIGTMSPANRRPVAGGLALGAQFILLWAIGRGPVVSHQGGLVVPVSAAFLLALTVLLTVLAPLGALFSRRFFQTIQEETSQTRTASVPVRGARRREEE